MTRDVLRLGLDFKTVSALGLTMSSHEKTVSDSQSELVHLVLPNDTNLLGNLLGGTLMHWIDVAGAVVANRHCRQVIVTASMDGLDFLAPIPLGAFVILQGRLNYVGRTSMEVSVSVYSENPLSGERRQTSTATLYYVAVNQKGKPLPVPRLLLTNDQDKRNFEAGRQRMEARRLRLQQKPPAGESK